MKSVLLLTVALLAWDASMARTWKAGDAVASADLKAGDVILMKNRNTSDAWCTWYGGYVGEYSKGRSNAETGATSEFGLFSSLKDRSAIRLVEGPEVNEAPSFYLQDVATGRYVKGVEDDTQALLWVTSTDKATNFQFDDEAPYAWVHIDANGDKWYFRPYVYVKLDDDGSVATTYAYGYYGKGGDDMAGWELYKAVESETSVALGVQVAYTDLKDGMRILLQVPYQFNSPLAIGNQYMDANESFNAGLLHVSNGYSASNVFVLEADADHEGAFFVKSEATGKYVTCDGTNTWPVADSKDDAYSFIFGDQSLVVYNYWNRPGGNVRNDLTCSMLTNDGAYKFGSAHNYNRIVCNWGDVGLWNIFLAEDANSKRAALVDLLNQIGNETYPAGSEKGQYDPDAVAAYNEAVAAAKTLVGPDGEGSEEDYQAAIDALQAAYDAMPEALNPGRITTWKEGPQIAYTDLKIGDVFLLKTANYQAVNNYGIWLSGDMSTIRNAWQTANQNLGCLPEIVNGSAYELVEAPAQHEGVPSYYLRNVVSKKYVYCYDIEGGPTQNTVLTDDISQATPFEIMSAREYSGRENYDEDAASLVTFVKGEDEDGNPTETKCCFSPFHFHGFTYYGPATDMCAWKFYKANRAEKQISAARKLTAEELVAGKRILINNGASYYNECGFYQWLNSSPVVKTLNDGTGAPGSANSMGRKPVELGSLALLAGINEGSVFIIENAPEGSETGTYVLKSEKTGQYITADAETRAVTLTDNIADAVAVSFEQLALDYGDWSNYKNSWNGVHYSSGGKWNVDEKSVCILVQKGEEKWHIGPAWSYGWIYYASNGQDNVPLNIYEAVDPTSNSGELAELVAQIGTPNYVPGDEEGQYDPVAVDNFNNAMSNALALLNGETPTTPTDEDYTAAYDALLAAYQAMPDAYHNFSPLAPGGVYYIVRNEGQVVGDYELNDLGLTTKPRDYNANHLYWNVIGQKDPRNMWKLEGSDEDGWTWQNLATGQYISDKTSPYNYNFVMLSKEPGKLKLEQVDKFVISISNGSTFYAPDGTDSDVSEPRWPERYGLPNQTGMTVLGSNATPVYWKMIPVAEDVLEEMTEDYITIANLATALMLQEEGINPGQLSGDLYTENTTNAELLNSLLAEGMSPAVVEQIIPQLPEVIEELAKATEVVPDGVYRIWNPDFTTKIYGGIDEASWTMKGRGVRWDTYKEGVLDFQFSIKKTGTAEITVGDDGMGIPVDGSQSGMPWSKKFGKAAPAPITATVPTYSIRNMKSNTYAGVVSNNQIILGTEEAAGPQVIRFTGLGGRYFFSNPTKWPEVIYKNQGVDLMTGAARDKMNTLAYANENVGLMLPFVGTWKLDLLGYEVEIGDLGMTTMNLPQAVTLPEGLTAYTVKEETDDKAIASPVKGAIPGDAAVVLRGPKGTYFLPLATEDDELADVEGNHLIGTGEEGAEIEAGTALVLNEAGTEEKFTKNEEAVELPARKAYLSNKEDASAKDIVYQIADEGIYYIERAGGDTFEGFTLDQLGLTAYPNQYHKMLNWGVIERNDPRYMWRTYPVSMRDGGTTYWVIQNLGTGEFIGERLNYFYTFIDLSENPEMWTINQLAGSTVTFTKGDTQLAADDPAYDPTTNRWAARFGFNGTSGGVKDISVVDRKGAYTLNGTGDNSKWNLVPVPESLVEYWTPERLSVAKTATDMLFQEEGNSPGQIDPADWDEFKEEAVALDQRVQNAEVTDNDIAEYGDPKVIAAAMADGTQLIKGVYRIKHPDGRVTIFGGTQWASWLEDEEGVAWDAFTANDDKFLFNIEKTGEEYVKTDNEVIVDDDQTADPWSKPFAAPIATAETTKGTNAYYYSVQNRATGNYAGLVTGGAMAAGPDPVDVVFKYTGIGGRYFIAPKDAPASVFYKNASGAVGVKDDNTHIYNSMWFVELVGFEVEISDLGLGTTCLPKTVTVPEGMKAYIII